MGDMLDTLLVSELTAMGADIVAFGALAELPQGVREGLPVGVSIAVKYPKEVIRGIAKLPTAEYFEWYNRLNERLDALASHGAQFLRSRGFAALPQTRERVSVSEDEYSSPLPHKTVATRAGVGWIGKSAMLVTERFGSMIRLSSVLTDAPLTPAEPINQSFCGGCSVCVNACPAGASFGIAWSVGMKRDELFDAEKCSKTAKERSRLGFGGDATVCGKCIEVCPYTRRYLAGSDPA